MAGGARTGSHAVGIADHIGCLADTIGWVLRGRDRVTVRASEPAGILADAHGVAIIWVVAVRRHILHDLKYHVISYIQGELSSSPYKLAQCFGDGCFIFGGNEASRYGDLISMYELGDLR